MTGPDASHFNPYLATALQNRQNLRNLPRYLNILNQNTTASALAQANAAGAVSPIYAQQDIDLRNRFGGALADANARVADRNVSNLADIFRGSGADLISASTGADRIANPEYYNTREILGKGLQDLIGGQDPNKLTSAETENVTRSVNRLNQNTGNANNPSTINTVSNAMMFGDELNNKRGRFTNALNTATGALPTLKSNVDTFRQVTGNSGTAGLGNTEFAGVQKQGESGAGGQMAGALIGQGTGNFNSYLSNLDMRNNSDKFAAGQIDY